MEEFRIRTYGRTELALLYNPKLTEQAAYCKLNYWIDLAPRLREALNAQGASLKSRSYNPAQVRLIVDALGAP